jgi:hypothetical protein
MDIDPILNELRKERDRVEEAITVIERLQLGGGKRRGRPPAWMQNLKSVSHVNSSDAPKRRGRPPGNKNKAKVA